MFSKNEGNHRTRNSTISELILPFNKDSFVAIPASTLRKAILPAFNTSGKVWSGFLTVLLIDFDSV